MFKKTLRKLLTFSLLVGYSGVPNKAIDYSSLTLGSMEAVSPSLNVKRQLDNSTTFYFHNLRENLGYNLYNSCTYVAAGALLSYYDSYLNDNFVPEKYEVHSYLKYKTLCQQYLSGDYCESPGIINDKNAMLELGDEKIFDKIGIHNISEQISFYSSYYLQFYLINLAKEKNLLTREFIFPDLNFENSARNILTLLNIYTTLIDLPIIDSNQTLFSIKSSSEIDWLIETVKSGKPVICSLINDSGTSGHSAIAYDYVEGYDDPIDGLVFHMGYSDAYAYTFDTIKNETYYNQLGEITFLNEDLITYSHSQNYVIPDGSTTCMCTLHINPHSNLQRVPYNLGTHYYHCDYCNTDYYEDHNFTSTTISDIIYLNCTSCGFTAKLREAKSYEKVY